MTNLEFLNWLFDHDLSNVFMSSVPGDPATGGFGRVGRLDTPGENNNYFCVSRVKDGRRLVENFESLHCLVIDDIGKKVDVHDVLTALGDPNWIIETSPGNFQWGYKLQEPVKDVGVANGLVEALCRTFKIGDMAGVNRLVRLPVGMNKKSSLAEPFETRLARFSPDRKLWSAKDLAAVLGAEVEFPEAYTDPFLPPNRDPVIQALHKEKWPYDLTRDPGKYRVECPWLSDHTGGRNDGAVYIAPAGFKCHHGHCSGKTFKDFRERFGLSAFDIDRAKEEAQAEHEFGGVVQPDVQRIDWSAGRFLDPKTSRPLRGPDAKKFEREWLFKDVVLADGTWILAGNGGEGKSRFALALCMSAATGIPLGPGFVPANPTGVRTLFVTQEDDDSEKFHRFTTQLDAFSDRRNEPDYYHRWASAEAGEAMRRNLLLPDFDPLEGLSKQNEKLIIENQKEFGPFGLVVWDPLVMFYDDDDENGMNSASGTRKTFARLVGLVKPFAKARGKRVSVGFVHHFTKTGTLMGSAMQTNLSRVVFGMKKSEFPMPGPDKQSTLTVLKSNASDLRDQCCTVELRGAHATVHLINEFGAPPPEAVPEEPANKKRSRRSE